MKANGTSEGIAWYVTWNQLGPSGSPSSVFSLVADNPDLVTAPSQISYFFDMVMFTRD
jgi:hypothetical protein